MRATILLAGAAGLCLALAADGGAQTATTPKARYYMDVSTATGPLAGGLRAMMRGGGESRSLTLSLGSTLSPTGGAPRADHFMPAGALIGPSVPLVSPSPSQSGPTQPSTSEPGSPGQPQRPRGRLLVYWGCGAHAGPGQPAIIDFAKVADGQFPPNLFTASVPFDTPPNAATSRTFGGYPVGRVKKPQAASSIVGAHRVAGNYSPEIAFSLAQDFLPALHAQRAAQADGSSLLSWNGVAGATGYYAWAIGAGQNGDVIWWASATTREIGGGLWDYVAPGIVSRLVPRGTVMAPSRTSCAIPAEVGGAQKIAFLNAFGPEADFAYPPRPANQRTPWHPDWTVKVRYKSTAMVTPSMGAMMQGQQGQEPARQPCRPSVGGMLGGMIGRKKC